jgi:hypothetical protein
MPRLKNGWGLASTVSLQSGQPFQFNYNFEDDYSGSGNAFDRPDVVGSIVYHPHDPLNYVDLTSFAIPCAITPSAQTQWGLPPIVSLAQGISGTRAVTLCMAPHTSSGTLQSIRTPQLPKE